MLPALDTQGSGESGYQVRRFMLIGAVLALVLGIGAGVAYASIPDSSGVIHACYQSPPPAHGANLQVIDTGAGGSCGGGMVPLTWNQTGPQGPAGPSGVSGYQVVTSSVANPVPVFASLNNTFVVTESANCPSGKVPLGGGASFTYDSTGDPVVGLENSDLTSTGWSATWSMSLGNVSGGQNKTASVSVTCANISS